MIAEELEQLCTMGIQGMLGNIGDGIILTDTEEAVVYLNQAAVDILNLTSFDTTDSLREGRLTFDKICPLVNIRTGEAYPSPVRRAMQEKRSLGLEKDIGKMDSWGPVYISATCSPIRGKAGTVIGCSVILRDVTEMRQLELQAEKARREAEEAARVKERFLVNMGHELRTPLNGVNGMLTLVLQTRLTPEQRQYLKDAKDSAETLLQRINDILDFSKLDSGTMKMEEKGIDLHQMLERIGESCAPVAKEKNLSFTMSDVEKLPHYVRGDPLRIRQIFYQLLTNAVKFTQEGGISLDALMGEHRGKSSLDFSVKDTGIGIDKENQERLFQPFSQADGSVTRSFGGTGIGLIIAKSLVDAMGGGIEVQSEPGKGSVFHFWIPFKPADGAEQELHEKKVLVNPKLRGEKIPSVGKDEEAFRWEDENVDDLLKYCESQLADGSGHC